MLAALLHEDDACRATNVLDLVLAHGFRCALAGGLAIDWQLRVHGCPIERRRLNDIDLVVEDFASIPESVVQSKCRTKSVSGFLLGILLLSLVRTREMRASARGKYATTSMEQCVLAASWLASRSLSPQTVRVPPTRRFATAPADSLRLNRERRLVSREGIEPSTRRLRVCCSAN